MDMKVFFTQVRKSFGRLTQDQVDGFNAILDAASGLPVEWQAYMLATVWHETAMTMKPIREYGRGKGKKYGKIDSTGKAPYGRGYVQLTWRRNYVFADKRLALGGALASNYDLALNPKIAGKILVDGMIEGWFTGKKLADYDSLGFDYVNARRIINGTDKAELIAGHAAKFQMALSMANAAA